MRKSVINRDARFIYSQSLKCFILTWVGSKVFPKKKKLELMTLLDVTHFPLVDLLFSPLHSALCPRRLPLWIVPMYSCVPGLRLGLDNEWLQ